MSSEIVSFHIMVYSSLTWKSHGVCQASYPVLRCFLPMAGEDIGAVTCRLRFDEGFGMSYRSTEALWELRRFRVAGSELAGTLAIGRGVLREKRGGHRTIQMQYIPISIVEYSRTRYKYPIFKKQYMYDVYTLNNLAQLHLSLSALFLQPCLSFFCRRQSDFTSPTMKLSSEGNQRGPQHTLCCNPLCILVRNPMNYLRTELWTTRFLISTGHSQHSC